MRLIRYLTVCMWLLFAIAVFCKYETDILYARSTVSGIKIHDLEGDAFRKQQLNAKLVEKMTQKLHGRAQKDVSDAIAATMLMGDFYPEKLYTEAPLVEHFKSALWEMF